MNAKFSEEERDLIASLMEVGLEAWEGESESFDKAMAIVKELRNGRASLTSATEGERDAKFPICPACGETVTTSWEAHEDSCTAVEPIWAVISKDGGSKSFFCTEADAEKHRHSPLLYGGSDRYRTVRFTPDFARPTAGVGAESDLTEALKPFLSIKWAENNEVGDVEVILTREEYWKLLNCAKKYSARAAPSTEGKEKA